MRTTIEPLWLLVGLLAVALSVKILVALFRRHRLSARQRAYREYLRTDVWKRLRREALERDGRRCRLCNGTDTLQVHHRYYPERLGTETADALTTLCRRCHEEVAHRAGR
jgi:5-methylcytosine-specific restriction endonuclease McrA